MRMLCRSEVAVVEVVEKVVVEVGVEEAGEGWGGVGAGSTSMSAGTADYRAR